MNPIAWNCRGLGNPRAIRALKELIQMKDPKLIFFMETKVKESRMMKLKYSLGFKNCVAVDCTGKSGGLAMLWTDDVLVELQS